MLLASLDEIKRLVDATGVMESIDRFRQEAFDLLTRGVADAFDLSTEDTRTLERYDTTKLFDASPTKAWLVTNRHRPDVTPFFEMGLGRRPAEELYDLTKDRHQLRNVASDPAYATPRQQLSERLMTLLKQTGDPRVTTDDVPFEKPPFAGPP